MKQTAEAIIDEKGHVRLLESVRIRGVHRALVTILDEPPPESVETYMLAEKSLAADWLSPEEDAAWSHLLPSRGGH
ncbi:MAG TPA: hypothetical protein DCY89_02785, partial [Gammaproteobacteria bacterium]|nr:hypothetical protein [Gammaproteobacteria bacterium]